MSPYFLFDSLCVAVGRLRPAALLKRWSWLIWLWAHAVSVLGQHRQRKLRGGLFSTGSLWRTQNNASPLIHFALVVADFSRYTFFLSSFFPPHGVFLKETEDTKKPFSVPPFGVVPPVFSGWSECAL